MSTQNALTVIQTQQMSIQEIGNVSRMFAASGMFPDTKEEAKAFVKIMAGQEMGLPPFAAMTGIHLIQGKPTVGSGLLSRMIKSSKKYDYRIIILDDEQCKLEFFEHGKSVGFSQFTKADGVKAGTQNTGKFPRNMYFARAISNGQKWYCPDVGGMSLYTPEDFGYETDGDTIIGETVKTQKQAVTTVDQDAGEITPKTNQKAFHAAGTALCGTAKAWDAFRGLMVSKILKEKYVEGGDFSANRLSQAQIDKAVTDMSDAARLATEKPASLIKHLTERLFLDADFSSQFAENLFKAHTKIDLKKACVSALEHGDDLAMALMAYADSGDAENDPVNF